jgi:hypothetical protein
MAINSPLIKRLFVQQQTSGAVTSFNNSSGTWTNTGAKLIKVDPQGARITKNAPYTTLPYVTGSQSVQAGVRGRKSAGFELRNIPIQPSGTAGTAPDADPIFQSIFGAAPTIVSSTSVTYAFSDFTALPISIFEFAHGSTTLTSTAAWGCIPQRVTLNYNSIFLNMDVSGVGGYVIDSAGFAGIDTQGQGGLTAFPVEPSSPTSNGSVLAGFGNGWTATLDSQNESLKVRVQSVEFMTGYNLIGDVYGSAYAVAPSYGIRRVGLKISALDDDSSALNDLKLKADTDGSLISCVIVAGTTAGSIFTVNLNNVQPNAFNLETSGDTINFDMPTSYANASTVGSANDCTVVFT